MIRIHSGCVYRCQRDLEKFLCFINELQTRSGVIVNMLTQLTYSSQVVFFFYMLGWELP